MTSAASTSRMAANGKETGRLGGGQGSTEALAGMLRAIAEAESQLSASRFPRAVP